MSEKIRYTDEPLGDLEVVPDFLPRPEDLVFRDEGVKVTISLSRRTWRSSTAIRPRWRTTCAASTGSAWTPR